MQNLTGIQKLKVIKGLQKLVEKSFKNCQDMKFQGNVSIHVNIHFEVLDECIGSIVGFETSGNCVQLYTGMSLNIVSAI